MSKLYSGAEIVFKCLEDQGVEFIFGYPGGAVLPIYDELKNHSSIKHILVRHEQGAGHAAEGYARSSGKPGVVLVTSGPGATNVVTALTDAYAFIKITHMERPNTDIRIVVNMANSNKEGEKTYNTILKACEGFLKFSPKLAGVIRRDAKVRDSIRAQEPLLTRFPNTEAANDVTNIVKNLEKD